MTLMTTGLYTVVRPSTLFWSQDIGAYVTPLRHRNARAPRMFECPQSPPQRHSDCALADSQKSRSGQSLKSRAAVGCA